MIPILITAAFLRKPRKTECGAKRFLACLAVCAAPFALLAQQVSAPVVVKAHVEGRVINSLNGEALPKATVILRTHDAEHGQSYADDTDSNGHFSIDDVEPGEYAAVAQRPGFTFQSAGATGAPPPDIKMEKGQQIKNLIIRLTPLAVIAGRVLDADGDPVRGATVNALSYVYSAGKKQMRNVEQVQSGDKGDFRLFGLRAGTFFLKVTRFQKGPGAGGPPHAVSTYYPGTVDESHAAPVELRPGAQLQGFDIRLQSAGGLYSVRFNFAEETPAGGLSAFLLGEHGDQHRWASLSGTGLVFAGVSPGSYNVVVTVSNADKQSYAIQHVEVVNADVDGGTLTLLPPIEVTGSVRVEGGGFRDLEKLRINLRTPHPFGPFGGVSAEVKADGSFLLKNAIPVVYELALNFVPGVYLKALRIGDKQLTDRHIDLASKSEPLTVVLGADVGDVEGSVQNAKGEPVLRARVNVIAYGDHAGRIDLSRLGFTDSKGEFKIKNVAPGDYKVFAWEDVPIGAPQNPEFRKPFEKQAASIRMQPNGHEKVSLTAILAKATSGADQ